MKSRFYLAAVAFLGIMVLALGACSPAAGGDTLLTENDSGRTIELQTGQKVKVIAK